MGSVRRVGHLRSAIAAIAILAVVGCGDRQDAAIAPALVPMVDSARNSLASNQDGLDSTFVFRRIRCRDDGGVLLLFDQVGPFGNEGTAFASSAGPDWGVFTWAGGLAPIDPATDPEIRAFFEGVAEIPCEFPPPR
jgi:hypothetical protein